MRPARSPGHRGDVALEVDDDLRLAAERSERLVDAGRAVDVIVAGHRRLAAGGTDRGGDLGRVGRHHDAADVGAIARRQT